MPDDVFGFLVIDKPRGLTSHDVVARLRRGLGIKKIGHAGTLDPMATGILVACLGPATRLSEYAMASSKVYLADVKLGETTDTFDAEGQVVQTRSAAHVQQADVTAALTRFMGTIQQVPPMYSAIKQGGRKLYELARAGQEVERPPRAVEIDDLRLIRWDPPQLSLVVHCGPGTYIRSLAHDIGQVLGVGAHLVGLRRTASGQLTESDAVTLDDLLASPDWRKHLHPAERLVSHLPAIHLDAADSDNVLHGRCTSNITEVTPDIDLARAYNHRGQFFALVKVVPQETQWRPVKVFPAMAEI